VTLYGFVRERILTVDIWSLCEMIDFVETAHVVIISVLIGVLNLFIKKKHQENQMTDVTFFHLLTLMVFLIPVYLLISGFMFNHPKLISSFIIVICFSIINYIKHLGTSFFKTEVFTSNSKSSIFIAYVVLSVLIAPYVHDTLSGAVLAGHWRLILAVMAFYHFNKSNISKKGVIFTFLLGLFLSVLVGWVSFGLFYYLGRNRVRTTNETESSLEQNNNGNN
jgi:hypothetical protein